MTNARIKETMERQGYSAAEIAEAIQKGFVPAPPAPPLEEKSDEEDEQNNGSFSWAGVSPEQKNDIQLQVSNIPTSLHTLKICHHNS